MKALVSICLLFASISIMGASERPNFLFLLSDDQRLDTVSVYGNPRISTPHLDALAKRGMRFRRATCSNPICTASRAELLTGTHGWENGFTAEPGAQLDEARLSWWADTLRESGYQTFYTGKWHTPGNPLNRGFQEAVGFFGSGGAKYRQTQHDWKGFPVTGYQGWIFRDPASGEAFPERGLGVTPDISSLFADAAIEVLEKRRDEDAPFFLSVNFTAPHDPLFMPTGMEGRYEADAMQLPRNFLPEHPFDHGNLRGRDEALLDWPRTEAEVKDLLRVYYSVVEDLDRQIGRILTALEATGEQENTYVIFSSDHGMAVGSHGLRGKQNMYEHTINVPLIIAGPGIEPGSTSDAQVYLRELYPTTCELAAIPIPSEVSARSFAPVLKGERDTQHASIFGYFRNVQRMIRRADGWKLIYYPELDRTQLFDLNTDPDEMRDLAGMPAHADVEQHLRKELGEWRRSAGDPLL